MRYIPLRMKERVLALLIEDEKLREIVATALLCLSTDTDAFYFSDLDPANDQLEENKFAGVITDQDHEWMAVAAGYQEVLVVKQVADQYLSTQEAPSLSLSDLHNPIVEVRSQDLEGNIARRVKSQLQKMFLGEK